MFKARRDATVRALKVMHPELSQDPAFVERFKTEIMTLAGLRGHRHLVEIQTFGYAADAACWYFLMEFIDGLSLQQLLHKKGPLAVEQARGLFIAVADGLAAAHAHNIVHRDVKPGNILVRPSLPPVLVDFGLAAPASGKGLTTTGRSAGCTVMFAAPEQLRGKPADARTDVYCLAASLYYAIHYDKPDRREPDQFEEYYAPEPLRAALKVGLEAKPERRPPDVPGPSATSCGVRPNGTSSLKVTRPSRRRNGTASPGGAPGGEGGGVRPPSGGGAPGGAAEGADPQLPGRRDSGGYSPGRRCRNGCSPSYSRPRPGPAARAVSGPVGP